jgi:GxxExxY protein
MDVKVRSNELSQAILDSAICVHRELGPGLLESAYEACLCHELSLRGISFTRQVPLPVEYKGLFLECGYRLDVVVEDLVIVELKSVEALDSVHEAQIISYLKLSKRWLGLLINFNVLRLKDGYRRFVNG